MSSNDVHLAGLPTAAAGEPAPPPPAPAHAAEFVRGARTLHEALKAEFGKVPFTVQNQAALNRIDAAVKTLVGEA